MGPTVAVVPELLRRTVASTVHRLFSGGEERPFTEPTTDDPGPIPLDSPVREVHRDTSMIVGGVRTLLYQTLHPDAMYGVAEHSNYESDPLGRLHRTAYFLEATVYGSADDAQQAIDVVRAIHSRVTGVLPDGRSYRADDPHLIGWVHATELDSFLTAFQTYGPRRLDEPEVDRYIADMSVIGEALGGRDLPMNRAELCDMLAMYREECVATPECRDTTRFLFAPQLPLPVLAVYPVIFGAATAMLPGWARRMLLLPLAPGVDPLVLRPAAEGLVRTLRWAAPR